MSGLDFYCDGALGDVKGNYRMTVAEIIVNLLGLLAGIGVFLVSIKIISNNLESVGSNRLKSLFARTSKSNLLGVGIGTAATALVQSSGATSVMTIGFVNAGIMSLTQACAIVLGANIGTTITGQIVAIGFLGGDTPLSASVILAALAGIGAFMMYFAKKDIVKRIGSLLAGFGLLFVGLTTMSSSMSAFANLDNIKNFIASINFPGYSVVLVLVGIVLTAIIQSSSVTSSIVITMLVSGLISLDQGIFLILGSNIGACVVALLACIGSSANAKRVAVFHILTNIARVFVFLAISEIITAATGGKFTTGWLFEKMFPGVVPLQLSMFHTLFNVVTVFIMVPMIKLFVKLSEKILPDKAEQKEGSQSARHLYFIDEHMLKTPPIAVQQTKNEVVNMAKIARDNFSLACDIVCTMDYSRIENFRTNEDELNYLNKEITHFVVQLSKLEMSDNDHKYLSSVFHTVTDLERIGDYAENITEYADRLNANKELFSSDAIEEIRKMQGLINDLYDKAIQAYVNIDYVALREAETIEDSIDDYTQKMADNHIQRLDQGICTSDVGAQYISLASNGERVADHFMNVAKVIREYGFVAARHGLSEALPKTSNTSK